MQLSPARYWGGFFTHRMCGRTHVCPDTSTSGYMVGAIPLTGVSLSTSQKMLLDNQFSYSPVVRGVARTNARLVIRQRGNIIYSTTLTPGPFAIDDLYSAQVGADLEVTVEESDGQVQVRSTTSASALKIPARRFPETIISVCMTLPAEIRLMGWR